MGCSQIIKNMKPKQVSPSKLDIFLQCAKKYHFEYLDEQMAKIKKLVKKKRPVLEMGSFVHDTLTLFFKLPVEKRTKKAMVDILKSQWQGPRGESFGFESVDEERDYYSQALSMLKWFVENEDLNPNIFDLPGSPPGKSFDDYKTIPFSDGLELGGKLDRVDELADGNLEIIDYKTGKEKNNNLQLIMYTFLAEKLFDKKVSKVTYLYLKSGRRQSFAPDENLRQQIREHILEIVEKIGKEKDWSPNISALCPYCDYLPYCPAKEKIKAQFGIEIGEPPVALG